MQSISYNVIILKHIEINSQFRKIFTLKIRLIDFFFFFGGGDNLYDNAHKNVDTFEWSSCEVLQPCESLTTRR